jgi:hypothetical protein
MAELASMCRLGSAAPFTLLLDDRARCILLFLYIASDRQVYYFIGNGQDSAPYIRGKRALESRGRRIPNVVRGEYW